MTGHTASSSGSVQDRSGLQSALGQDADGGAGADGVEVAAHLGEVVLWMAEFGGRVEDALSLFKLGGNERLV